MPVHNTYRLGTIEMLDHDLGQMTLEEAMSQCQRLGKGWRLPTLPESRLLKELADLGVGGFHLGDGSSSSYYWTTTVFPDNPHYQITWTPYPTQNSYHSGQDSRIRVRPVRSL